jgi:hypothetical protein
VAICQLSNRARFALDESGNLVVVELGLDQSNRHALVVRLIAPLKNGAQHASANLTFDCVPAPEHLPDIQTHRTTPRAKVRDAGISHD